MAVAFLGLGSNLGDRTHNTREALRRLSDDPRIRVGRVSSLYESAPVGGADQPDFMNSVVCVETDLSPSELLGVVMDIERDMGRVRNLRWGPRVIDIDLLLYDTAEMKTDNLSIPHPRMAERAFVIRPLAEIAPDLQIGDKSVQELARKLSNQRVNRLSEVI